jgi:phosphonate transport system permease protein
MRVPKRIPLRKASFSSVMMTMVLVGLSAWAVLGFFSLDAKGEDMGKATFKALDDLRKMLFEFDAPPEVIGELLWNVLETLALSFITTLVGAVLALVLGLAAARNIGGDRANRFIKGIVAFVRAVPTELWVLIFAIGAGLGSIAAVIGMSFHTLGYLIKAFSESFEEIDPGVIEALKASGAKWPQIVAQAILPETMGSMISWFFVRFEVNFAVAVTVGAAAGAGGIGFDLFWAASFAMNIRRVGFITILILIVSFALELLANAIKARFAARASRG